MDIEPLLTDTFVAHEALSPDESEVLAAVRRRTERRSIARPLAVAASVAVVAGTAVAVVVAADGSDRRPDAAPAVSTAPSTVPSVASSVAPSPSAATRSAAVSRIRDLTMPFDLRWLPAGDVRYDARRINVGAAAGSEVPVFNGEYLMTVATPGRELLVDVQQMAGGVDGSAFKSGAGADVQINGRHGFESRNSGGPGGYEVYFRSATGGTVYVNVGPQSGKAPGAAELTAIGRRVARNVAFPGTATVTPSFAIGDDLPGGLQAKAFDISDPGDPSGDDHGTRTSYELFAPGARSDDSISVGQGVAGEQPAGREGADVQGRRTTFADDNGYRTLTVLDAVDGGGVSITGFATMRELYAIAGRLILPE